MSMSDDWNPLYGGDPAHDGYDRYLTRMDEIFAAVKTVMKNNARVVVHCDDVPDEPGQITPLKNDIRGIIENSFSFIKETHITWTNAPAYFPQTHCLIFENCKS